MSKPNSTPAARPGKPVKPYPDYPLFPHATKRWAKKIRGEFHYFGSWADGPYAALAKYLEQKDALHAGRKPKGQGGADGVTVRDLCNKFLNFKQTLVDSGELTKRSWVDYKAACDMIVSHFGKGRPLTDLDTDDFGKLRTKMAKKWGPVTLGNVIQRMRVVFKFAADEGLIDRAIRYGQSFKRPSRKAVRLDRAKKGARLFTAEEIRRLICAAGSQLKAMILLGINAGFGNSDCGTLPLSALNLETGWVDYPRPKTGIARRAPLWLETVAALREALAHRPEPKQEEHAGLVFVTKYGAPWAKETADHTLAKEFGKLLRALHINGRKGLGFYTLRHVFRTVGDEAKDQVAVNAMMGHADESMAAAYREAISDTRLRAVTDYVRGWLFGSGPGA